MLLVLHGCAHFLENTGHVPSSQSLFSFMKPLHLHSWLSDCFPTSQPPGGRGRDSMARYTFAKSECRIIKFSSECFKETLNLEKAGGVTLYCREPLELFLKSKLHCQRTRLKWWLLGNIYALYLVVFHANLLTKAFLTWSPVRKEFWQSLVLRVLFSLCSVCLSVFLSVSWW